MVGISCKHCGWVHGEYDCRPEDDQERAAPAQQPVASEYGVKLIAEAIIHHFGEQPGVEDERPTDDDTTLHDVWEAFDALVASSSEPELRAEIVSLTRERDEAIRWRREVEALSEEHLEDTGQAYCYVGIRDYAAMCESVEALSAEVGTARAAAFEEAAQIAEAERKQHDTGSGFDSQPAHAAAFRIREAIRSRAALDKGATTT